MAAKPIVDGIERAHEGNLTVIHLNVQENASQEILQEFEFRFTPTFILFDSEGKELQRWVGAIDSGQVRQLLEEQ